MLYCDNGDVLTALTDGEIKLTFGSGVKAQEWNVAQGDVIEIDQPTKVTGNCELHHHRARPKRTLLQVKARPQRVRECSLTIASLELPDMVNASVKDIEMRLEQRGLDMRQRLAKEAEKLKR